MISVMKKLVNIIVFVALSFVMMAQDNIQSPQATMALSLEEYRQKVLDYSQELKQAQEAVSGADYQRKAAVMGYLPRLDFSADVSYGLTASHFLNQTLDPFNYSVGANLVQNVFAGGAIMAQHKMAKTDVEIAELSEQLTKEEVLYRAEMVYWNAAASKEMLENAESYYALVMDLFNVVDQRFEEGMVSKSDLLMVNTRLKEAELQRNSAKRVAAVAFQNLNILMGQPVQKPIDITDDIYVVTPMPEQKTLDAILSQRPEYLLVDRNIQKQQQYVSAIYAQYNPMIAVGVRGAWGTPTINFDGSASFGATAYATLSVPLLEWGKRTFTANAARTEVSRLNLEKVRVKDQINSEMSSAWISLNDNYKQIQIARDNFVIASDNLELNNLRYKEGQLPILDVLSSQLSWIQAFNAIVQAEFSFKSAYADYKKAIGDME